MRHADVAVVVTNPEVSSVRDSDRIIGLLDSKTEKAEKGERVDKHLLLTRYDPIRAERGEMLKVDDVLEILSIPLLGIIPESQEVLRASNLGQPVTISNAASAPARAYADAVRRLRGETLDHERARARRRASWARCSPGGPHERASLLSASQLCSRSREAQSSASAARDRLKVLLAHERAVAGQSKLVEALRDEILAVIGKHVAVERDKVQVKMDHGEAVSTLAIEIELPASAAAQRAA